MLYVIMRDVIVLSVIMLSVIMLSVIMLSVVVPFQSIFRSAANVIKLFSV
jgi:hypothetical protein